MGTRAGLYGIRVLAVGLFLGAPATASAHAFVSNPPARDVGNPDENARAHKTGPCGGIARFGTPKKYTPGETITVTWKETIAHQGCFQIGFTTKANPTVNADFTVLKQINDPAGGTNMPYTDTVTLPAGMKTPAGTLVVRQLMNGNKACANNPANPDGAADASGGTYYSCADICVGDAADPCTAPGSTDGGAEGGTDAGPTTDGGGTTDSGVSTTPTDGGGSTVGDDDDDTTGPQGRRPTTADDGGCNTSGGLTSSTSVAVAATIVALTLTRRRRKS